MVCHHIACAIYNNLVRVDLHKQFQDLWLNALGVDSDADRLVEK